MNDLYYAHRLAEELKLAERSMNEKERSVRLRACFLLCGLLDFQMEQHPARLAALARAGSKHG